MAPVTIDAGARNSYYSAGNVGWSARSIFAYRTAIQQLTAANTETLGFSATTTARAQSFTPGANMDVNEIRIAGNKEGSPTDNVTLAIYSDTGANLPNASIAAADNVHNGATMTTAGSWWTFQFATPVSLTSGTKYWIVVARSGADNGTNYYVVRVNNGSAYAGGGRSTLNTGVWQAESASVDLAFQILTETPSALYAVTQSTTPELHVWKSTDSGATWTEQDTADNPSVTNANYPFDACDTRSGPYIGTARFTNTNTVRVALFDMSTDQWGSDLGAADASTDASNERTIRIAIDNTFNTAAPGTQNIWMTALVDDADLVGARRTTSTWAAVSGSNFLATTSVSASLVADVVVDKSSIGFQHRFYYEIAANDFSMRSAVAATYGTATDLDAAAADVETEHTSATYQIYQVSNVDRVIAAYIASDGHIQERTASLEVTSASVTLGTQHEVAATTTTAGRQLSTCEYDGDGYVVVSVSGTDIDYYTDSGLAGSWSSATNWKTGLTACTLSRVMNVPGIGLAVVYTDNGDVKIDWIDGGPASDVTVNGSLADISGAAFSGTVKATITGSLSDISGSAFSGSLAIDLTGSLATITGEAFSGTVVVPVTISGSLADISGAAFSGSVKIGIAGSLADIAGDALAGAVHSRVAGSMAAISGDAFAGSITYGNTVEGSLADIAGNAFAGALFIDLTGALADIPGEALSGSLFIDLTGALADIAGNAFSGTPQLTVDGSLADISGEAFDGALKVLVTGLLADIAAEALDGQVLLGYTISGGVADIGVDAPDGSVQITGEDDFADRYRFFQIRPKPTGM